MINEIHIYCVDNDRYGFTLPYLYKIERDAGRKKPIDEILLFLSNAEKKYLISYCDDLEEYIVGLPKRESAPTHMYHNFGNLHYDQDSLGPFDSIEELSKYLTDEYQCYIDNKTFSKKIETLDWE